MKNSVLTQLGVLCVGLAFSAQILAQPHASQIAVQRLEANLGEGCRFAVTLPGKKGVRVPSNSDQTAVGGNPEMRQGGMIAAPYPAPWKSTLPSIGFNLYCYERDDPKIFHTTGVLDPTSQKWTKNVPYMRKYFSESTDHYERELAEQIIATTRIYDIQTINAHGWADTYEELTGDERFRKRSMAFCLFRNTKAICGRGDIANLYDGPKGDLTPYALEILRSIEFLDDASSSPSK